MLNFEVGDLILAVDSKGSYIVEIINYKKPTMLEYHIIAGPTNVDARIVAQQASSYSNVVKCFKHNFSR